MRLFYLQFFLGDKFLRLARDQQTNLVKTDHERGMIFDKKRVVLATNIPTYSLYANPRQISKKKETASKLSSMIGLDKNLILKKISKDKSFVWIKRKIDRGLRKKIEDKHLYGVRFFT